MAWYNVTAVNASGVLPLVQSVRTHFFNPLGDVLLLIIFAVSYFSFMHFNNNPKLNIMFSSFGIAIFSIFFSLFGLVSSFTPFLCWGLFGISISIVTLTK